MVIKKVMGGSVCALVSVMVVLVVILNPVTVNTAKTCQVVISKILPCEQYLRGNEGMTVPCCQEAQALNQMANSTADRQLVCKCFKQVGPYFGIKIDRAQQLPILCKIDMHGIPIDHTVDCNTIKV
ncbi:non-specific lipid-transfer protein-like [Camellia sinensis]|uniref:non-specific lipid-transfer protein-like n=1 Tax=Camellia sinensis TaxID=4442 RepID=UPI001036DD49|nr:non-specific lipid-transfer protein-like [Camellia sinensis]